MKFSSWLVERVEEYEYEGKTIKDWGMLLLKKAMEDLGKYSRKSQQKLMVDLDYLMQRLPSHSKQMSKDKISKDEFSIIVMDYLGNHDKFNDPVQKLLNRV